MQNTLQSSKLLSDRTIHGHYIVIILQECTRIYAACAFTVAVLTETYVVIGLDTFT